MDAHDILKMLDIAPEPVGEAGRAESSEAEPVGPFSPTALLLDDWSLRRGREAMFAGGCELPQVLTDCPDRNEAAADFIAAAFEPRPELAARCMDETRHRYMSQLMQTEEYAEVHNRTALNYLASEMAAVEFAKGYVQLAKEEGQQQAASDPIASRFGLPAQPQKPNEFQRGMAALSAASAAMEKASEQIDELEEMQNALGIGSGKGEGGKQDLASIKQSFKRIRNHGRLRDIINRAGRFRRLTQAKQRQKTLHGRDDVVGIELGNDLGRLTPYELACLTDPDLEMDAMRRFLERSMMCRKYRGVESRGKGPIVFHCDESSSMDSRGKIENAKAWALSVAWMAKFQKRWCCLVSFSGGSELEEGSYVILKPGKWDQTALMDWLERFDRGGTEPDVPLVEVPKAWGKLGCPAGKTDVIFLTDGEIDIEDRMAEGYNAWKHANKVKHYTVILGCDSTGDMAKVSDQMWAVPYLDVDQPAIQELMAI